MTDLHITIITESSELSENISPLNNILNGVSTRIICNIDGCYHIADTDKLCKEHHLYSSMQYIIAYKPMQSPVAASKYSMEQRGLSCIQMHIEESE